MIELGFIAERARFVLFSEFSFKRSVVFGPEFPVLEFSFKRSVVSELGYRPIGPAYCLSRS
jgi:hypothetical protein